MGNTKITIVTELKEFESLVEVWDNLSKKCQDENTIFLTHEWLSTWWKHFGKGKKLNILLFKNEHQVIGILPLMRTEHRIGFIKFDVLQTLGIRNCNYVGLIIPKNREEVLTTLLSYLEEEIAINRVILIMNLIPEDSQFLHGLRRHSPSYSRVLTIDEKEITVAPYIALTPTWDEYYSSLSGKRRQTLRRALQSLRKAHIVGLQRYTADTLESELSKFFDLHEKRWQSVGIHGGLSNPKMKEFYRDLASLLLKKNWLHFSGLTVDKEVVSAVYGCIYNQKFFALTSARDTEYSKYSVGHLHYMFLIKDAISKGLKEFDFLRGDEPYKMYWTKSVRRYMQVIIIKKGFWFDLWLKLLRVYLRLHWIRQYSLKEIYRLYWIQRKENKEKRKMGLKA